MYCPVLSQKVKKLTKNKKYREKSNILAKVGDIY